MGGSGKKVKDPESDKKKAAEAPEKQEKKKPEKKGKGQPDQSARYSIIRVAGTDLDGDKPISLAIMGIKGVGWVLSNAICEAGGFDPKEKLSEFDDAKIKKIEEVIKSPSKFGIPIFMTNRRRDVETGEDMHLTGDDLKVATRFDIQRHVDIKTYRGWRHMMGQPVRGQHTRSKFREKGRVVGVLKKGVKMAPAGDKKEEKK